MKVFPLASDSLGVRSMATYVECGQTRVLIDPGAALGPNRFGMPPADAEWEALKRANDRISGYAALANLIFLSHYHEDHFRHDPGLYEGRTVWAKDAKRMINPRQAQRAGELWKAIAPGCRLDSADGRTMETADARLAASSPLAHGVEGTQLGYVVALTVTDLREGTRFVHASDVQGPLSAVAAAYLMRERPDILYLSGPPAYLERQVGAALIDQGIEHLLRVLDRTDCRVILDHHALRAESYPERFRRLWETGRVVTAAGYLGLPDEPLESRRPEPLGREAQTVIPNGTEIVQPRPVGYDRPQTRYSTGERRITGMSEAKTPGVGDAAPAFTMKTIGLKEVSLKDYPGKNVVLLFYPLDWTPG